MGEAHIPPILYAETLTPLALLHFLFRRSTTLYYSATGFSGRLAVSILRPLCPALEGKLVRLRYSDLPGSEFDAEEETYFHVNDAIFERYRENIHLRCAIAFSRDPLAALAVKKEIYNRYCLPKVKALILLHHLIQRHGNVEFIPSDPEDVEDLLSPEFRHHDAYRVPPLFRVRNRIRRAMEGVLGVLAVPILLAGITLKQAFKGMMLSSPPRERFSIGFDCYDSGIGEINRYREFFLNGKGIFHPSQILRVVRWRLSDPETGQFYQKYRIPFTELGRQKVPAMYMARRILMDFCLGTTARLLKWLPSSNINPVFILPAFATMKMTLDAELLYLHYDIGVFIARDDYSPFHVIRTLVANRFGGRTVGYMIADYWSHDQGKNFFVFDRYALWGPFYREFYAKALAQTTPVVIGAGIYGLDRTHAYALRGYDPPRYRDLRGRYRIVSIVGTTHHPDSFMSREVVLSFYRDALDATEGYMDVYRIIKHKIRDFDDQDFHLIMERRERAMVDDALWTYRLLLLSDLIICIGNSSVGIEALMAGRKVLYYELTGNRRHLYARYHPHLVSFTREELREAIRRVLSDGWYLDEEILSEIRERHGHIYDGRVVDRLRSLCRDLLPLSLQDMEER